MEIRQEIDKYSLKKSIEYLAIKYLAISENRILMFWLILSL